jgi:hypothetical protein
VCTALAEQVAGHRVVAVARLDIDSS